ncbi:unnamed protein product [Spirodela intermedia]|uniref:Uncharacterized protein n=1 Tax=Spirodela intermedia TaxID=51605 RepID=A0A7I8JMR8_SPIIN|nr:unnamed protein product [Spirodela intermedia]CAA6671105.1 unnamed protein product [Spirodela intermedia]
MQPPPPQGSRRDLIDLKSQIIRKLGPERSHRYFSYLNRLLGHRLCKSEFDKFCWLTLGPENIPLHNRFIRLILKNAYLYPPAGGRCRTIQEEAASPGEIPAWPSFLCTWQKHGQSGRGRWRRAGANRESSVQRGPHSSPLGVSFSPVAVGGVRRGTNHGDFSGELCHTEALRERMERIAGTQHLGTVTMECADLLNKGLDLYMKRVIMSCVGLAGSRSEGQFTRHPFNKNHSGGNHPSGIVWLGNQMRKPSSIGSSEGTRVSLLDFRVAMELNPQQLGKDWPFLLERVSVRSSEEQRTSW